jgi:transposase
MKWSPGLAGKAECGSVAARPDIRKKTAHALEQERADLLKRRREWFDGQLDLDPARLVFIDETGLSTRMPRLRGRSLRGQRCRSAVPHGHWKTTTFTGAPRPSGMTAPMVPGGAMNGVTFRACVGQVLAPTLTPGDIVVMDNLSARKAEGVRHAIEQPGCQLRFLPPCSPDFNPIENACSKLKAHLRAEAERSVDALWNSVAEIVKLFEPQECANYSAAAGHDPE